MNEKFNNNANVEKLTKKVGRGVRLIVIGPCAVCILLCGGQYRHIICVFVRCNEFRDLFITSGKTRHTVRAHPTVSATTCHVLMFITRDHMYPMPCFYFDHMTRQKYRITHWVS